MFKVVLFDIRTALVKGHDVTQKSETRGCHHLKSQSMRVCHLSATCPAFT